MLFSDTMFLSLMNHQRNVFIFCGPLIIIVTIITRNTEFISLHIFCSMLARWNIYLHWLCFFHSEQSIKLSQTFFLFFITSFYLHPAVILLKYICLHVMLSYLITKDLNVTITFQIIFINTGIA